VLVGIEDVDKLDAATDADLDADVDAAPVEQKGECDVQGGSCDSLTECANTAGGHICGACPSGFVGTGADGCVPTLTRLDVSAGTLSPALAGADTDYTLALPLLRAALTLTLGAPAGAKVEVNGDALGTDGTWSMGHVPLAMTTVVITVGFKGHDTRTYTLRVQRAGAQSLYVKTAHPDVDDGLGRSVALDANTWVMGAPWEDGAVGGVGGDQSDNGAYDSGAVYVWTRSGSSWKEEAYLKASEPKLGSNFGNSVALDADTLAVGADGEDDFGAVYVFTRNAGVWQQQARIEDPGAASANGFGRTLALEGDTLIIGAPGDDHAQVDSGAAHVFTRSGSVWTHRVTLHPAMPQLSEWFGSSAAIEGNTLIVGATGDSTGDLTSGAAYVFTGSGAAWSQQVRLKSDAPTLGDFFGESVALSGGTLVVGAFGQAALGAAHVFVGAGATWTRQAVLKASNPSQDAYFGIKVAMDGDVIVVGSINEDSGAKGVNGNINGTPRAQSGAAYVYQRAGDSWTQLAHLKAAAPGTNDNFGSGVAVSGDRIAVGAMGEASAESGVNADPSNDDASGSGAGYLFE
jgi:hypothetical protein